MFDHAQVDARQRRRILFNSLTYTVVACVIVSATVMALYDRVDWPWELAISNVLTVTLAFSMSYFIGTKLEHITQLSQELKALVERDRLTDVATRDFFFSRLAMNDEAYGVSLMIDIDHFKAVNDTYGHLIGDEVIARVAQVLRVQVREEDIVCRFGGEEFLIFLHEATTQEGWKIAERIRVGTQNAVTPTDVGQISVTVSVGGSLKEKIEDIEASIQRADACLYRAKAAGRNTTIVDWELVEPFERDGRVIAPAAARRRSDEHALDKTAS
ncbi:MAG: GGDEF domain-containing protein [Octadecabacter sp.]|nr:GGDEF domain-containing protein [Octadecabacter sp.]